MNAEIEKLIDVLFENSNHGTRRKDVVAAFKAGAKVEREACARLCEELISYDEDDPGTSYADAIRARSKA